MNFEGIERIDNYQKILRALVTVATRSTSLSNSFVRLDADLIA
jgi:hypothetical protein